MSGSARSSAFAAALQEELSAYVELCELLRAEQTSLERGEVDQLQQLTDLKARQVDRLAALGASRVAHLEACGLPANPKGMETWLRAHAGPQQRALTGTWKRLLEAAAEARTLNELNGGLVATRLNHSQAALATLHAAVRQDMIYGPDGRIRLP